MRPSSARWKLKARENSGSPLSGEQRTITNWPGVCPAAARLGASTPDDVAPLVARFVREDRHPLLDHRATYSSSRATSGVTAPSIASIAARAVSIEV